LASKPVAAVFSGLTSKSVATISPGLASKSVVDFVVEPQNQGGGGFPCLGLKTSSYGLVIWSSESWRRFLGLGLKTKQATVYRLCHKTDGTATVWDTHQDLANYFMWKQIRLLFSSLASRLAEVWWQVVHVAPLRRLHRGQVENVWVDAMGCVSTCYPYFAVFFLLGHRGIVVFLSFTWAYK
jgi:hypothetical protein